MSTRGATLIGLAVIILLTACGGPPAVRDELVWPAPPAPPQVKYVGSFHGSADMERGFFGKVKDFLFGAPTPLAINKPYGVTFDGRATLYVAETALKGILAYDLNAGKATFYNSLGKEGALIEPVYVILDSQGRIYVSDTERKAVTVFEPDFTFSHFIGGPEVFSAPVGMALSRSEDKLYVVDTRGHDVKVFTRDGELLRTIGHRGDRPGEFHFPTTVATNDGDTIYIVDSFHFAVQAFDTTGKFLFSFGPTPNGPGALVRPRDIAIDSEGLLYITDATRNNVQVFNPDGTPLLNFGGAGVSAGEFQLPAGISITRDGRIYVADSINRRVQIFERVNAESSVRQ